MKLAHPRIVVILEGSEESSSFDFTTYLPIIKPKIGSVDLVIAIDCFALSYERLWVTTSTRGIFICDIKAEVLNEGVHSGDASGIVPDSFRIIRKLLDKIEDVDSGQIIKEL